MSPELHQSTGECLRTLLTWAWLLPLAGFVVEIFAGYWSDRRSKAAACLAIGCIATGFLLSATALVHWGRTTDWGTKQIEGSGGAAHMALADEPAKSETHGKAGAKHEGSPGVATPEPSGAAHGHDAGHGHEHDAGHGHGAHDSHAAHAAPPTPPFAGSFYSLGKFGSLEIGLDWYIDSLTLIMFAMVTFIATCIHVFATGYMAEELTEDYVDHQVHMSDGGHLHRPGRFYKFFAYLSLFCFSMLGLVLAGNIFQVFVFWELVGVCSYFLIGFYVERKSASTAANKAFIMNRVGDFGFLIGLMVIVTWFGTFRFGDQPAEDGTVRAGLFTAVRGTDGVLDTDDARSVVYLHDASGAPAVDAASGERSAIPYVLLLVAGLGVFAGCIGKSAQFPLQTWLPDAMEGPTPVSALVHSATMVAAGVYLTGRFYPLFAPEVLLTIAYIGCITAFLAATIAIVATDIKRVLAYSTISQLGYMMLGLGVGGWAAGLFHLVTHAFFKSLMFLASGSVIAGCHHEQEMPKMGGLWRKMPITAFTMLIGVIAISGLAVPGLSVFGEKIAFSGYHSKDAIVATALAFTHRNPVHFLLFLVPLITAGITAFYMFRLWFFTFAGAPRDAHVYDHCHESPPAMTGPLVVLSVLAACCAVGGEAGPLFSGLLRSEPVGVAAGLDPAVHGAVALPSHHDVHAVHADAGSYALLAAFLGTLTAYLLYGRRVIDPAEIRHQLAGLHGFLVEKWRFDELYDALFVRPARIVAGWCAAFDRKVFDGFLHGVVRCGLDVSRWDRRFDEGVVDGLVNLVGNAVFSVGRSLRAVQTGSLRQYVMFIALGVLTLFVLLYAGFPK